MNHPFNLELEDLEQLEFEISSTEVAGSRADVTTMAIGEEGGDDSCFPSHDYCFPKPSTPSCYELPTYTTRMFGENGGCWTF